MIQKHAGSVHPWCWISYLQIMAFCLLLLAWKRKHFIPFMGREAKGYISKHAAAPSISICQKGAKPMRPQNGDCTWSEMRGAGSLCFPTAMLSASSRVGERTLTYPCQARDFALGQRLADGWCVDFGVRYWLSFQKVFSWFINVYFNHFPHEFRILWHQNLKSDFQKWEVFNVS